MKVLSLLRHLIEGQREEIARFQLGFLERNVMHRRLILGVEGQQQRVAQPRAQEQVALVLLLFLILADAQARRQNAGGRLLQVELAHRSHRVGEQRQHVQLAPWCQQKSFQSIIPPA